MSTRTINMGICVGTKPKCRAWLVVALVLLPGCRTLSKLNPLQGTVGGALIAGGVTLLATGGDVEVAAVAATIGGIAGCYIVTEYGKGASREEQNEPGYREARDEFEKAIEEARKTERLDLFIERLEESSSHHARPETFHNLAVARIREERFDDARALLKRALNIDPRYEPSLLALDALDDLSR